MSLNKTPYYYVSLAVKLSKSFANFLKVLIIGWLLFYSNHVSAKAILPKINDPRPQISDFTPKQGSPGDIITIYGSQLGVDAVYFGGVRAEIIQIDPEDAIYVRVKVPRGATYGPITVVKDGLHVTAQSNVYFTPKSTLVNATIIANYTKTTNSFTSSERPSNLAVGDFDQDGKQDVVISNDWSSTIAVYRNTSKTFGEIGYTGETTYELVGSPFSVGSNPQEIAIGDINGDGKLDIAVASYNSSTVSIFINSSNNVGDISFNREQDLSTGSCPFSLVIADMDKDGRGDIVVANKDSNSISIFRNTGQYGLVNFDDPFEFQTGAQPFSIKVGDINGDEKLDLVVSAFAGSGILIYNNISADELGFEPAIELPISNAYNVTLADLDEDGKLDIISGNMDFVSGHSFSIFRNTSNSGTITFSTPQNFSLANRTYSIALGDLNGDGKVDLTVAGYSATIGESKLSFYRNTSSSGNISIILDAETVSADGPTSVKIFDVDKDGVNDIVYVADIEASLNVLRTVTTTPVSLSNFDAKLLKTGEVQLSWLTSSEQNNSHFDVYRSTDGQHFTLLKSVKGNGTTSVANNYSFIDTKPATGKNYYKLQQTDFNGKTSELGVKALTVNISYKAFVTFPNPFTTSLKVSFEAGKYNKVELFDVYGKLLKTNMISANSDQSVFEVESLNVGSYIIRLSGDKASLSKMVIKN